MKASPPTAPPAIAAVLLDLAGTGGTSVWVGEGVGVLVAVTVVYETGVGRRQRVHALCERDEDGGHAKLFVGEVAHDIRVEAQHTELVVACDS